MSSRNASFRLSHNGRHVVAIVKDGMSSEATDYFKCQAREQKPVLSFSYGNYDDLSFLSEHADWIHRVSFNNVEKVDWNVINSMQCITSLKFSEATNASGLIPESLPNLKWLDCYWSPELHEKLNDFISLESLLIRSYGDCDLAGIEKLIKLKDLEINFSKKLRSIESVSQLRRLRYLWLSENNKLEDVSAIANCTALKTLCITINNEAYGFEALGSLSELEELILSAKLPNLHWAKELKKLRIFRFDCVLENGDISFLTEMKQLQHVFFKQKRNLNVKLKDVDALLRKRGFDPDSEDPDFGLFRAFPDYP